MSTSYKAVSRNIKAARKSAGLTQEAVAEQIGLSLLQYGRLERGERRISLMYIDRIAGALGVSGYALLHGCFPDEPGFVIPDPQCMTLGESIDDLLGSCSAESRRLVYSIAWLIAADFSV